MRISPTGISPTIEGMTRSDERGADVLTVGEANADHTVMSLLAVEAALHGAIGEVVDHPPARVSPRLHSELRRVYTVEAYWSAGYDDGIGVPHLHLSVRGAARKANAIRRVYFNGGHFLIRMEPRQPMPLRFCANMVFVSKQVTDLDPQFVELL